MVARILEPRPPGRACLSLAYLGTLHMLRDGRKGLGSAVINSAQDELAAAMPPTQNPQTVDEKKKKNLELPP